MNIIIDKLVEVLAAAPEPVLPRSNMGIKEPSSSADIPAIVASLTIDNYKCNGLGRFIRSGDSVVKNSAIVEVKPTSETFSEDLKSLLLSPLPLKKNPSSIEKDYTQDDISVRNVTDPAHPINYLITNRPSHENDYRLDSQKAQIIFGKPQKKEDILEVIHWTITWRDEIFGKRYSGLINLEIWSSSFDEADEISRKLQYKLNGRQISLKDKGFSIFQPASLESTRNILHSTPSSSPFSTWRQKLAYKFTFEAEEGGEISSGIPIKQINVDMDDNSLGSYSISRK